MWAGGWGGGWDEGGPKTKTKTKKPVLIKNTLIPAKIKEILTVNVTIGFEVLRIPVKMKSLSRKGKCSVFLRERTRRPAWCGSECWGASGRSDSGWLSTDRWGAAWEEASQWILANQWPWAFRGQADMPPIFLDLLSRNQTAHVGKL